MASKKNDKAIIKPLAAAFLTKAPEEIAAEEKKEEEKNVAPVSTKKPAKKAQASKNDGLSKEQTRVL